MLLFQTESTRATCARAWPLDAFPWDSTLGLNQDQSAMEDPTRGKSPQKTSWDHWDTQIPPPG